MTLLIVAALIYLSSVVYMVAVLKDSPLDDNLHLLPVAFILAPFVVVWDVLATLQGWSWGL